MKTPIWVSSLFPAGAKKGPDTFDSTNVSGPFIAFLDLHSMQCRAFFGQLKRLSEHRCHGRGVDKLLEVDDLTVLDLVDLDHFQEQLFTAVSMAIDTCALHVPVLPGNIFLMYS